MPSLTTIGRAERIDLPVYGLFNVPAKIDTGADTSSIWASEIEEKDGKLTFCFFDSGSKYYTGEKITMNAAQFKLTRISNSFGQKEVRYSVKVSLVVKNRKIRATVTLANRMNKTYPILLGRRILNKKFIVDVSQGEPLLHTERKKQEKLREYLTNLDKKVD